MKAKLFLFFTVCVFGFSRLKAQSFFFGADLSYVNEMEDCGAVYKENGTQKDPWQIFADNQCNLVRLRLWHTPSWYDNLNAGNRYSDFQDVKRSILRAKTAGMKVLLDFHLSDNWADPGKQRVPDAWLGVVNNLPVLKDSLYNYISRTLLALDTEGLLPEMVQIGNETNKGILLSPQDDTNGWVLNWGRNSALFNRAIQAVRDVENTTGKKVKVTLHVAGPADVGWMMDAFWNNGVTDFDIIGLSYYWAWHKPASIADAGQVIAQLRQKFPGKEVMVVETGYIWTTQSNDNAGNIISEVHPDYSPASPENQRDWLVALTQEVINRGGKAVIYWEPAWVSSICWTQWGQGSHQEHATFFDFQNNVLPNGGINFMTHQYDNLVAVDKEPERQDLEILVDSSHRNLVIKLDGQMYHSGDFLQVNLMDNRGTLVVSKKYWPAKESTSMFQLRLPELPAGVYYAAAIGSSGLVVAKKLLLQQQ